MNVFIGILLIFPAVFADDPKTVIRGSCNHGSKILSDLFWPIGYEIHLGDDFGIKYHGSVEITMKTKHFNSPHGVIVMHVEPSMIIKAIELEWKYNVRRVSKKQLESSDQAARRKPKLEDNPGERIEIGGNPCQDLLYETLEIPINQQQWTRSMDILKRYRDEIYHRFVVKIEFENVTKKGSGSGLMYLKQGDNPHRYLLYTHIEPGRARTFIPCFDEPRFQADFRLIVEASRSKESLIVSNTRVGHIRHGIANPSLVHFIKTDLMNADQIVLVKGRIINDENFFPGTNTIFKFIRLDPSINQDIWPVEMYKRAFMTIVSILGFDRKHQRRSIFTVAALPLENIEELNGLSFVAKDSRWFSNASKLIEGQKVAQHIAQIVDQVARQWIGGNLRKASNYDTWLYEALVGHIVLESVPLLYNFYDTKMEFVSTIYSGALDDLKQNLDASIMDINQDILDYFSLQEQTDFSNYDQRSGEQVRFNRLRNIKAYGIIRLIKEVCGVEIFRLVIRQLEKFAYKVFRTSDFFKLIRSMCKWDPKDTVVSLLSIKGYPLIVADLDESGRKIKLTRSKYTLDYLDPTREVEDFSELYLPVTIIVKDYDTTVIPFKTMVYFSGTETSCEVEIPAHISNNFYVKLNRNYSGFYRVAYSDILVDRFKEPLALPGMVNNYDQVNLINDALSMVKNGLKGAIYLIRLLRMLKYTPNEFILNIMISSYIYLKTLYNHSNVDKLINSIGNEIFIEIFRTTKDTSGVQMWNLERRHVLSFIYSLLINMNNKEVINWSHETSFEVPINDLVLLDPVHQGAHLAYLARCDFVACDLYFDDLINTFSPSLIDGQIFSRAMALSDKERRLKDAWEVIIRRSPNHAQTFIQTAMLNVEGLKFIRHHIIEMPDILKHITYNNLTQTIRRLCLIEVDDPMCNKENIISKYGINSWDYIDSMKAKRARIQLLQLNELESEIRVL